MAGLAHSAEEAAANDAATAAPVASDTAAVAASSVTLRNAMSEVVLNVAWAEITHFKLLDHQPLDLPAAIGGDETLNPEGALSVLGPFNRNPEIAGHNSIIINSDGQWSLVSATERQAVFSRVVNGLNYQLSYQLDEKLPRLASTWTIVNNGDQAKQVRAEITAINGIHQDLARNDAYFNGIYVFEEGELEDLDFPDLPSGNTYPRTDYTFGNTEYISLRSRFFAGIWQPGSIYLSEAKDVSDESAEEEGSQSKGNSARSIAHQTSVKDSGGMRSQISVASLAFPGGPLNATQHQVFFNVFFKDGNGNDFIVKPGQQLELNWQTTVTSMRASDLALLSEAEAELEFADGWYNFFRSLCKMLLWLLNLMHGLFENMGMGAISYGLAILCTTAIVKGLLHRLTYKQQYSMMKMQQLAPELRRLQAQYKNDRQAMAMKQMELWKKHGVNPFGGCLPLLIQMPIFIALFQVFNHAGDMRGHGFLWVTDLTLPDQTIPLGFNWPLLGSPASINLLPLLYLPVALFQSLSMKITTPNSGDKQKDEMQASMQKMFRYMPVFFFLFIYFFASGLVLYIFVSSLWSLVEIRLIRRKLGMDTPGESKATVKDDPEPKKF